MLTQNRVLQLFDYDESTGAGTIRKDGYVTMNIDGNRYYAHRVIWLMLRGDTDGVEIDHIDHNPSKI